MDASGICVVTWLSKRSAGTKSSVTSVRMAKSAVARLRRADPLRVSLAYPAAPGPHRARAIHWKRLAQQKRHEKVAHEAVPRESEEAIPRASCPRGGDPKRDFRDSCNAPGELPRASTPPNHARCAGGARLQPQGQLPIAVLSTEGNPHRAEEHWHIYQRAAVFTRLPAFARYRAASGFCCRIRARPRGDSGGARPCQAAWL